MNLNRIDRRTLICMALLLIAAAVWCLVNPSVYKW